MRKWTFIFILLLSPLVASISEEGSLKVEHAGEFEVALLDGRYVTYLIHDVILKTATSTIHCDSAIWSKGEYVNLRGNVIIDDNDYLLKADSAFYRLSDSEARAFGDTVTLWSYADSTFATGPYAYYKRSTQDFFMDQRPTLYINYPDTSSMIEVTADVIEHQSATGRATGEGDVVIVSNELSAQAGCAIMNVTSNDLDLFDSPTAVKGSSKISGSLISIKFQDKVIHQIDVVDSARGELSEPVDSLELFEDKSILEGNRIIFDFAAGVLHKVTCYGQAYSWYYPSARGRNEFSENSISGDTITLVIGSNTVSNVMVNGGAVGTYISGQLVADVDDSTAVPRVDSVDYSAQYIEYNLKDSLISLDHSARISSESVSLEAYHVRFDTDKKIIEAFSAEIKDSLHPADSGFTSELQPNPIPVVLRDGNDQIFGDYLEYSIDSEKGRIVQSKTQDNQGLYYGDKLFREQREIFYVDNGRFSTCDAKEPHFHFHSKNMKMINQDKLIARPVVFYIERLPIMVLPFYIFPLQKGRRSGILTFKYGQFHQGDRFIQDLGYYWAVSDYFDFVGSMDYHEKNRTMIFKSRMNFVKRYLYNGYIKGEYARETDYITNTASETLEERWKFDGAYSHTFSPDFSISGSGHYQSSKDYYDLYSLNLEDRLNRELISKFTLRKKFGNSISLTASADHTVKLDLESRIDNLPSVSLSLPTIWLFGSGKSSTGKRSDPKWYHDFTLRYNPNMQNYSSRVTIVDTLSTVTDSTGAIISADVNKYRSRKKFTKINHNPGINLPQVKLLKYLSFRPSISYSETWYKIYETDQSIAAGIDAGTEYRAYSYGASVSAQTEIFGTVYPHIFGIAGLRHSFKPVVSYTWSPEINLHPDVRQYAFGGPGGTKRSALNFSFRHLFQAKIQDGETVKNLDNLLSITSGFSYNFENEERPLSSMRTSFSSTVWRNLNFSGGVTHNFYEPGTNDINFWSPYIERFDLRAGINISGSRFLFDESDVIKQIDSAATRQNISSQGQNRNPRASTGWSLSANFTYSESGREATFRKDAFLNLTLGFSLTPTTRINYSQGYDIDRQLAVNRTVRVVKTIHCWTGSLVWIPAGSNRGFGFSLFVTGLPDIKLDSSHDSFLTSIDQR